MTFGVIGKLAIFAIAAFSVCHGEAAEPSPTGLGAILKYCLPALAAGDDPARLARLDHLREILHTARDTEFMLPDGTATLTASSNAVCSVFIHTVDPAKFARQLALWFNQPPSPFRQVSNATANGVTRITYEGTAGKVGAIILVGIRLHPKAIEPQVIISVGRK